MAKVKSEKCEESNKQFVVCVCIDGCCAVVDRQKEQLLEEMAEKGAGNLIKLCIFSILMQHFFVLNWIRLCAMWMC